MRRLHLVPEISPDNGMYNVACLLAKEDGGVVYSISDYSSWQIALARESFDEVWVHGMWLPRIWRACWHVLRSGKNVRLLRMTHGSLSPIYLKKKSPLKKLLVSPIERYFFSRSDAVIVTGEHEADWCSKWRIPCRIIQTNLKRFFDLPKDIKIQRLDVLRVLYLGRDHPLKGVNILSEAVKYANAKLTAPRIELRVVHNAFGEQKNELWDWCNVLCLPTFSENFGLVVAEALQRGVPVITTDGAPVWKDQPGVIYIEGYCSATPVFGKELLAESFLRLIGLDGGCPP